jgi:hypothetical protein
MSLDLQPAELLPILLLCIWILVLLGISSLSGWARLASVYLRAEPFTGNLWKFQSARMRGFMRYNNCLTLGANAGGLYLSIFFLFRPGHPPLFIPWRDITITSFGRDHRYLKFHFRGIPEVPFIINDKLREQLSRSAGYAWPGAAIP